MEKSIKYNKQEKLKIYLGSINQIVEFIIFRVRKKCINQFEKNNLWIKEKANSIQLTVASTKCKK